MRPDGEEEDAGVLRDRRDREADRRREAAGQHVDFLLRDQALGFVRADRGLVRIVAADDLELDARVLPVRFLDGKLEPGLLRLGRGGVHAGKAVDVPDLHGHGSGRGDDVFERRQGPRAALRTSRSGNPSDAAPAMPRAPVRRRNSVRASARAWSHRTCGTSSYQMVKSFFEIRRKRAHSSCGVRGVCVKTPCVRRPFHSESLPMKRRSELSTPAAVRSGRRCAQGARRRDDGARARPAGRFARRPARAAHLGARRRPLRFRRPQAADRRGSSAEHADAAPVSRDPRGGRFPLVVRPRAARLPVRGELRAPPARPLRRRTRGPRGVARDRGVARREHRRLARPRDGEARARHRAARRPGGRIRPS